MLQPSLPTAAAAQQDQPFAVQIRGLGVTLAADNGAEAPGPSDASSSSSGGSSSTGAVIGGVVGGLIAAAVIAAIAGDHQGQSRQLAERSSRMIKC